MTCYPDSGADYPPPVRPDQETPDRERERESG